MKKIIITIIAISIILPTTLFASGEWSEWWVVEKFSDGSVKRIYDKENKLVCWIYNGHRKGGISCVPSLELNNPLYAN